MLRMESYYTKLLAEQKWSEEPMQISLQLLLNRLLAKWTNIQGIEDYYVKPRFVEGYPSYLFREEEERKRENDRTQNNICIFPPTVPITEGMEKIINRYKIFPLISPKKKELFHEYLVYQERIFYALSNGKKDKYQREAVKRIRFFDMVADEEDDSAEIIENAIKVMEDIRHSSANTVPLFAVLHLDEDYPHVHFLYLLDYSLTLSKRELKKIPHIEQIIKLEYGREEIREK